MFIKNSKNKQQERHEIAAKVQAAFSYLRALYKKCKEQQAAQAAWPPASKTEEKNSATHTLPVEENSSALSRQDALLQEAEALLASLEKPLADEKTAEFTSAIFSDDFAVAKEDLQSLEHVPDINAQAGLSVRVNRQKTNVAIQAQTLASADNVELENDSNLQAALPAQVANSATFTAPNVVTNTDFTANTAAMPAADFKTGGQEAARNAATGVAASIESPQLATVVERGSYLTEFASQPQLENPTVPAPPDTSLLQAQLPAADLAMPNAIAELRNKLGLDIFKFNNKYTESQSETNQLKLAVADLNNLTEQEMRDLLAQIAVIAFEGPSGTGKSTRASQVAFLSKCSYIIDDGLLIKENKIVAGSSAKRAQTKIESVRQAIFLDNLRANIMRRALATNMPKRLLILGTSESMINKICKALWLNSPQEWIRISDVASANEIKQARYSRLHTGQHAIPVPLMELKHEFSGSIFEPWERLRRHFSNRDSEKDSREASLSVNSDAVFYALSTHTTLPFNVQQSIVRPSFSVLGHYSITDQALNNIVGFALQDVEAVARLCDCTVKQETSGLVFKVNVALYYGYNAQVTLQEVQRTIMKKVTELTAMNVLQVAVVAKSLVHKEQLESDKLYA